MDDTNVSVTSSCMDSSNGPPVQLEYILEYLTQDQTFNLPEQSLNDLISLVCDESKQPENVPPYLLAASCRTVFTPLSEDAYFEEAMTAIDHLKRLEGIRSRYITEYKRSSKASNKVLDVDKVDRETSRIFDYTITGLKRWTFANEIHAEPFNSLNCLATINLLFPSDAVDVAAGKERTLATTALHKINQHLKSNGSMNDCAVIRSYESSIPWERAHAAMSRYLDLALSLIARIEGMLEPIPVELRKMGIKREECVLHRISRHLIATDKRGFNPEESDATQTQTQTLTQTQRSQIGMRDSSPEL